MLYIKSASLERTACRGKPLRPFIISKRMIAVLLRLFCLLYLGVISTAVEAADPLMAGGCFDRQVLQDRIKDGSLTPLVTMEGTSILDVADYEPRRMTFVAFNEGGEKMFALLRANKPLSEGHTKLCVWMLADSGKGSISNPQPSKAAASLWFKSYKTEEALKNCVSTRKLLREMRDNQLTEGPGGNKMSYADIFKYSWLGTKALACGENMEKSSSNLCIKTLNDRKSLEAKEAAELAEANKNGDFWCDTFENQDKRYSSTGLKLFAMVLGREFVPNEKASIIAAPMLATIYVTNMPANSNEADNGWTIFFGKPDGRAYRVAWGKTRDSLKINESVFPK